MEPERFLVIYCRQHEYGKLISIAEMEEFDTEGNLQTVAACLQICRRGFFKRKPCVCELHGVVDIDEAGMLTLNRQYGFPQEKEYPKGWKIKYYLQSIDRVSPLYRILEEYFNRRV